jgi:glucose-6-phosphate isomerase
MTRTRCDQTPAWQQLRQYFDDHGRAFDVRAAFAADPGRFAAFSQRAPHVFADLSKNLIDAPAEHLLLQLAQECGMVQHRDAMFAGEPINRTENRAVMHFLLRYPRQVGVSGSSLAIENACVPMTPSPTW